MDYQMHGTRYVTVRQLPEMPKYDWLTVPALRHMIFNAKDRQSSTGELLAGNGLDCAIIRVGRKILIDILEFDQWLGTHRDNIDDIGSH